MRPKHGMVRLLWTAVGLLSLLGVAVVARRAVVLFFPGRPTSVNFTCSASPKTNVNIYTSAARRSAAGRS